MRQRGAVLIDLILGLVMSFLVGAVIMSAMQTSITSRQTVLEQNDSQTDARQPLDIVADHLRNAQLSGNAAISAGNKTSVSYYPEAGAEPITYSWSSGSLSRTEDGKTSKVLSGVTSLSLTYYRVASYNSPTFVPCINPSAPSALELPVLGAIQIDATVSQDGYTANYSTIVRLRNSPRKTSL